MFQGAQSNEELEDSANLLEEEGRVWWNLLDHEGFEGS